MTRVGWLVDEPAYVGGAERTQAEFKSAAPAGVEIVACPHGGVVADLDVYVMHNSTQYTLADVHPIEGNPVVKYHHDVGPWVRPDVRTWIDRHATPVCCSPLQAEHMGLEARLIPPPVDLDRFATAADAANGDRSGAVCVGSWRNATKGSHLVAEWSVANDTQIDFYGGGEFAPPGCQEIAYKDMPGLLARYETFVFLPTVIEPFGRIVAEAWAAGCRIVTNRLVGSRYWLEGREQSIEEAADDFWALVLA